MAKPKKTKSIKKTDIDELAFSISLEQNLNKKNVVKFSDSFKSFVETIRGQNYNIQTVNFKSKIVKFSSVLTSRSFKFKILLLFLAALIMGLMTLFLVKNSGLYSLGISGIFQGIARIAKTSMEKAGSSQVEIDIVYNILFWSLNILINIPLVIFAYKFVSKQFAYLTIMYIVMAQLFGLVFDFIPGIGDIYLFGSTKNSVLEGITDVSLSFWSQSSTVSLLVYCLVNAVLSGLVISLILMVGSSTGGTDIISMYFSKAKNKPVGIMLLMFNNSCLFISTLIGSFGSLAIIDINLITHAADQNNETSSVIQSILSPNFVFSATMAIICGITIDFIFPRSKFVQVKIYTKDVSSLKENLLIVGYKHDMYVNEIKNGLTNEIEYTIETICMYIELTDVIKTIRSVDNDSLITLNKLEDIDGKMNVVK